MTAPYSPLVWFNWWSTWGERVTHSPTEFTALALHDGRWNINCLFLYKGFIILTSYDCQNELLRRSGLSMLNWYRQTKSSLSLDSNFATHFSRSIDRSMAIGHGCSRKIRSVDNISWSASDNPWLVQIFVTKISIFSSGGDVLALEAITNGMRQWSSKTCITFKERTDEKAFIYFFIGGRFVTIAQALETQEWPDRQTKTKQKRKIIRNLTFYERKLLI